MSSRPAACWAVASDSARFTRGPVGPAVRPSRRRPRGRTAAARRRAGHSARRAPRRARRKRLQTSVGRRRLPPPPPGPADQRTGVAGGEPREPTSRIGQQRQRDDHPAVRAEQPQCGQQRVDQRVHPRLAQRSDERDAGPQHLRRGGRGHQPAQARAVRLRVQRDRCRQIPRPAAVGEQQRRERGRRGTEREGEAAAESRFRPIRSARRRRSGRGTRAAPRRPRTRSPVEPVCTRSVPAATSAVTDSPSTSNANRVGVAVAGAGAPRDPGEHRRQRRLGSPAAAARPGRAGTGGCPRPTATRPRRSRRRCPVR